MQFLTQPVARYLTLFLIILCGFSIAACQEKADSTESETAPPREEANTTESDPDQLVMAQYAGEGSIEILYPAAWTFHLPRVGLLMFATKETIELAEPGPLMTILRVSEGQVHGNAEGELNHYLDFGPLRSGYTQNGDYKQITVNGQEAWEVSLSYEGNDENIPMEAYIVSSETESGAVYIFTSTSPAEMWDQHEITFKVMVNSVEFTE